LLVLDLNGTLIHRTKKTKQFYARPHLGEFLERVLKRYAVLIWSSARPENVRLMASHCFKEYETYHYLAALWDRRAFQFTREEYAGNPVTVKNLEFIWNWRTCWHARNTLIVDDSPEKVERQPKNWIYLSTFTNTQEQQNDSELLRLATYLEEIANVKDIRSALDVNPF
ncbi:HAD-like domain-containing protein, partial [Syncephalis plumigaleata]